MIVGFNITNNLKSYLKYDRLSEYVKLFFNNY